MDHSRTDGAENTPGGTAGPSPLEGSSSTTGRSSRRLVVVLTLVLGGLIAGGVALLLGTGVLASAPGSELEGQWSGTGTVASCRGIACAPTQQIDLTIDCSWTSCTVPVFGGYREIKQAGARFRASGSIPPQYTRPCAGGRAAVGTWELDLGLDEGALVGRYTESTTALGCGGTGVEVTEASWDFTLDRT